MWLKKLSYIRSWLIGCYLGHMVHFFFFFFFLMPTQILWHRKWVFGKTCTKWKAQITFSFLFWETKAQITSRILFDELQEYSAILSKTMCSKWASQGIQLNPFIDRATQPINSPPWYIDMGFYDPSLQFTIWAF